MSGSGGNWEPVQKVRNYEQVMAQLEDRLLTGQLKPGDQLPSERDLAAQLGISRPSLREALRVLEALGIIEVRLGGGPGSGTVIREQPGSGYGLLMRLELALGHFSPRDILLSRLALEEWCFWHASQEATADDVAELTSILEEMEGPDITIDRYMAVDTAFHGRVAEVAGNRLNAHILRSLRNAIHPHMVDRYRRLSDWRTEKRGLNQEHRAMLVAIEEGESEVARSLIRRSITGFYDVELRPRPSDAARPGADPSQSPAPGR